MSAGSTLQSFQPGPDTGRDYRDALGFFGTGVTVVTANTNNGPVGITANSFSSVSLDPPLVLWSLSRKSKRFSHFSGSQNMAIHVLSEVQSNLCHNFAATTFSFEGVDWVKGADGTPLINDCLVRFECKKYACHDGGDHEIIVSEVVRTTMKRQGTPLLVFGGNYGRFASHTSPK